MRVMIRKQVDVNQPVNLKFLQPIDKIIVAVKKEWTNTKIYKSTKLKSEQALHRELVQKEDTVKDLILATIYKELTLSKTLSSKHLQTKEVIISIDAKYSDILFDRYDSNGNLIRNGILTHNEFAQYNIVPVDENADLRRAFTDMPHLFRCSRKVIM